MSDSLYSLITIQNFSFNPINKIWWNSLSMIYEIFVVPVYANIKQVITSNQPGCNNDCYDEVHCNSCYDEAGCNGCNDEAGLSRCYNKAGRISILLRILCWAVWGLNFKETKIWLHLGHLIGSVQVFHKQDFPILGPPSRKISTGLTPAPDLLI